MRDRAQELVAHAVAVGVVDRLEAVEIDVQHRERAAGRPRRSHRGLEPQQEEAAIGQTREAVEARLVQEQLLRLPPRGDVLDRDDPLRRRLAGSPDHARFVTAPRVGAVAREELGALAARILEQAPQPRDADDVTVQRARAAPGDSEQLVRRRVAVDHPVAAVDEDQRLRELLRPDTPAPCARRIQPRQPASGR